MDNARLEGSGYIAQGQQQASKPAQQQQGGFANQGQQQQGGFANQGQQQQQQQRPKANPQEPTIDFDDDIPF
jgi:single-strand DNA-binding protein